MALGQNPASLPADDGPGGNNLRGGPHDVHALVLDQDAGTFRAGTFEQTVVLDNPPGIGLAAGHTTGVHTSRVVEIGFPFSDVVPSYNLDCPEGAGALFEIRFGRAAGDFWTPWYYLGFWGDALPTARLHLHDEHGAIEIDCYRSPNAWDRVQYRVKLTGTSAAAPVLRRFALACSNTLGDADLAARMRKPLEPWSGLGWTRRLPVPYRSQTVEDPKIRGSICSPTSVSMVLQYYGVNRPTAEVAARVYDPVFKLYGNWGRAVQTRAGLATDGPEAQLQVDCMAGVWTAALIPQDNPTGIVLSAGDLEEGISGFLALSATSGLEGEVSAFRRFEAFRTGFFDGITSCGVA